MNFEPDNIWGAFIEGKTFESYCNHFIPTFQPNPNVPETIKRRLSIIHKLMIHAYYEYEFLDIAYEKMFNTFEFALHLKYMELNPNSKKKMSLKPLLDWAVSKNILKISVEQKKILNDLRNHVTHLKQESIMGKFTLNMINTIGNDLINQLFPTL